MAAPIKLPRQEGFMVDRDKDGGIDEKRMAAERNTAAREQSITRKDEITEESRLAHKQSVVLQGPGKVRASSLAGGQEGERACAIASAGRVCSQDWVPRAAGLRLLRAFTSLLSCARACCHRRRFCPSRAREHAHTRLGASAEPFPCAGGGNSEVAR